MLVRYQASDGEPRGVSPVLTGAQGMANLDVGACYQSDQGAFSSPRAAHDGDQMRACGTHVLLVDFTGRDISPGSSLTTAMELSL